jgi:hypothetical protein
MINHQFSVARSTAYRDFGDDTPLPTRFLQRGIHEIERKPRQKTAPQSRDAAGKTTKSGFGASRRGP